MLRYPCDTVTIEEASMTGGLWNIITVAGPILLLAVLAWAVLRNRATPGQERRTEEGTRRLYAEEEQETKRDEAV